MLGERIYSREKILCNCSWGRGVRYVREAPYRNRGKCTRRAGNAVDIEQKFHAAQERPTGTAWSRALHAVIEEPEVERQIKPEGHSPWISLQEQPGPELQPEETGPQWDRRAGGAAACEDSAGAPRYGAIL